MNSNPKRKAPICELCHKNVANLKRPKTHEMSCKPCFYEAFETEIHETIIKEKIFQRGEKVAIAVSGGKDSTVLAHIMKLLNDKYNYGLDLFLLSIDEGIKGYRDDSLETVKRNKTEYQLPLKILSYSDLYNWTMDEIVKQVGTKNNCSFCGVFRRQALDRGCEFLNVNKMVTGHNADDIAETVLMNILRGDVARLQRCVSAVTFNTGGGQVPRAKPFKYTYEKEIVLYAFYKKLDYFSTECTYSVNAYRGFARELIKDLERIRPQSIIDIILSAEQFCFNQEKVTHQVLQHCEKCGYISSQKLCRACILLEGLNTGKAKMAIYEFQGKVQTSKQKKFDNNLQNNIENQISKDNINQKKLSEAPIKSVGVSLKDLDF